ncbi:glycoside hydrolase family 65 protein [Cohnella pontilimi]|uniref:Glycoside hydrolase family 65 protein n=1 Tax=Cohnella pontilimi TaxID=2564100 RepID=A0A4U0FGY7_9BACL|nr:glycoside hydrolase family 65 protein [Cohnella pontilimi]TJY42652.1 glycoside hydrolase family 65 protein [Cohnella pontilimi]
MIEYTTGRGEWANWIVAEKEFDVRDLAKYESIFALGNGYLGMRACTEESYPGQTRNSFVAGTFNRFDDKEVTELPNTADFLALELMLNGERFHLEKGTIHEYSRTLNLKNGELTRRIVWESAKQEKYELLFRRFVSMQDLHLIGMRVEIMPLTGKADVVIKSGIDGTMTNSGAQHFHEGDKKISDGVYLQMTATTTETSIDFAFNCTHRLWIDGSPVSPISKHSIKRRYLGTEMKVSLQQDERLVLEKTCSIHTSNDVDNQCQDLEQLKKASLSHLKQEAEKGYETLFAESARKWEEKWEAVPIKMTTDQGFDQLAIRFAQYHLAIMTPSHDSRISIGAKGLTGEGYKGHVFWDTEVFILPYFLFTDPSQARKLLEYRYHTLGGARLNAKRRGFQGAMYPWESAGTGEEETPEWGPVDVVTGTPTRIWTGLIEQHITSDVAYGVWQYYRTTGDREFMIRCGYEIIMETANFWASRLEWDEPSGRYHINDVIGPDEYKEHVNNNAFTNYMAHWNLLTAIRCHEELLQADKEQWEKIIERIGLAESPNHWAEKAARIYLPQPRQIDEVIPQDDTYLQLKTIDLSKYRNQAQVGLILDDYNMDQVSQMQVSKQADLLVLFYLLENQFPKRVKQANWNYFEPLTVHDSSLSLSTHCVLACDVGDRELAYRMFEQAARIDLGTNMKSSDEGIHTASIGGIWKSVVLGFGGVRSLDGKLRIDPCLPAAWETLEFPIYWQGDKLSVRIDKNVLQITNTTNRNEWVTLEVRGNVHTFKKTLRLDLSEGGAAVEYAN